MRRFDELLRELGFNKDAPLETQKAFFKHLVRSAESSSIRPVAKEKSVTDSNEQLSFDPEILKLNVK